MVSSRNIYCRAAYKVCDIFISHLISIIAFAPAYRDVIIINSVHLNISRCLVASEDYTGCCVLHENSFIFDLISNCLFQCNLSALHALIIIPIRIGSVLLSSVTNFDFLVTG